MEQRITSVIGKNQFNGKGAPKEVPLEQELKLAAEASNSALSNLDVQEKKTRIAFLENEQAELETEIRTLKGEIQTERNGHGNKTADKP